MNEILGLLAAVIYRCIIFMRTTAMVIACGAFAVVFIVFYDLLNFLAVLSYCTSIAVPTLTIGYASNDVAACVIYRMVSNAARA